MYNKNRENSEQMNEKKDRDKRKKSVTTVLSPKLFDTEEKNEGKIVVVTDILRASTTLTTAVYNGAVIVPVSTVNELEDYRLKGYLVAGERLEREFKAADFGNSPLEYTREKVEGKTIVHSSTNGTKTMVKVLTTSPEEVLLGAFSNIEALSAHIAEKNLDLVIVCSGWRGGVCIEDTLFAGALAQKLFERGFETKDDATNMACFMWKEAQKDMWKYLEKASHVHRLRKYGADDSFSFVFTFDTCPVVPKLYFDNGRWEIRKI